MGTITLSGVVTWEQAASLRDSLVREATGAEPPVLDVTALEKIDTGILQLLLAFQEACHRRGMVLQLRGSFRQDVKDLIRDLGFGPQVLGERVS